MIDVNNLAVVRWLVEAAANGGSPDPEGLVAQMQVSGSQGNMAAVSKQQAKEAGIADVSEPFMSFSAAVKMDQFNYAGDIDAVRRQSSPRIAEQAIANRSRVQDQYSQAVMNNVPPRNPFFNAQGQLVLQRRFKSKTALNDPDSILGPVVDEFLDELDADV